MRQACKRENAIPNMGCLPVSFKGPASHAFNAPPNTANAGGHATDAL